MSTEDKKKYNQHISINCCVLHYYTNIYIHRNHWVEKPIPANKGKHEYEQNHLRY